jgi:hypothetical protein
MTYSSQLGSRDAAVLSAAPSRGRTIGQARRLPPGIGLAIGALVSLALWAGLALAVIRLIG